MTELRALMPEELLDAMAMCQVVRRWLRVERSWSDRRAADHGQMLAGLTAEALALALADPTPRVRQTFLEVAADRAVQLRGEVAFLEGEPDAEPWIERCDDLYEAIEAAGATGWDGLPESGW